MSGLHNIEAEQILLGFLMDTKNTTFWKVEKSLSEADFYEPLHQRIYSTIEKLWNENIQPTPITLDNYFTQDDALNGLCDGKYLYRLLGKANPLTPYMDFVATIKELSIRRRGIESMQESINALNDLNDDQTAEEIIAEQHKSCLQILEEKEAKFLKNSRDLCVEIYENMKKELPCYSTGIDIIDQAWEGGLYRDRTYCIAADKKMGKTTMLQTISHNMNVNKVEHLFICAEMGSEQIHQRNISRAVNRNAIAFLKNRKDVNFQKKVAEYGVNAPNSCWFADMPGITFERLRILVQSSIVQHDIKGVFVDYLQLVTGKRKTQTKADHIAEVAQWLADISKKEGIFVMYAAQTNREGAIRDSDGADMAADVVFILHKEVQGKLAWLQGKQARYFPLCDIGGDTQQRLIMDSIGPHYREVTDAEISSMYGAESE